MEVIGTTVLLKTCLSLLAGSQRFSLKNAFVPITCPLDRVAPEVKARESAA